MTLRLDPKDGLALQQRQRDKCSGASRRPVSESKPPKATTTKQNAHPEDAEQSALFEWRDLHLGRYPELAALISIPNGAHLAGTEKQRWAQMARLKRTGLKPGVSDVLLPIRRGPYGSLWIEMKAPGKLGNLSDAQREWGALMAELGNFFVVCDVWGEAANAIEWYLKLEGT